MYDAFRNQLPDSDAEETQEWLEALDQVIDSTSPARARYLMNRLLFHARTRRIGLPAQVSTDYINTISPEEEPYFPGNEEVEHKIRSASTISSEAGSTTEAATTFSFRAMPRPAFTRAASSRAGSITRSSIASAARRSFPVCRVTRIRDSCPSTGSSRPSRWASAH
jgi:hypothetical protein